MTEIIRKERKFDKAWKSFSSTISRKRKSTDATQVKEEETKTPCETIFGRVPPGYYDENAICDYSCVKPKFLQSFRTARCVLLWKCWGLFTQSLFANAFIPSSLTSIEKDFNFSSSTVGFLASMFDVGLICVLLPISFWGNKTRRLRLESYGYIIMGCASLALVFPHVLTHGTDRHITDDSNFSILCLNSSSMVAKKTKCNKESETSNGFYIAIFAFALLSYGIGSAPILTTGTAYIDDNTSSKQAPMYIGIYMSFMLIGAASGFVINSNLLKFYVDLDNNPRNVKIDDLESWIGAWWIGPLISSLLIFIAAVPLYGFPVALPGANLLKRMDESFGRSSVTLQEIPEKGYKSFFESLFILLKNKSLIFLTISATAELFFISGISTFGTKIIEKKFFLSIDKATMYSGGTVVVIGALGFVSGGAVHSHWNLTVKQSLRLITVTSVVIIPLCLSFLIPCNFDASTLKPIASDDVNCSNTCGCSRLYTVELGCGADGRNYLTPCHAGCKMFYNDSFHDCGCIVSQNTSAKEWTRGKCPFSCSNIILYTVAASLATYLTFFMACPALNILIRIVPKRQKSLALGFASLISRILGSIPSPAVIGYAFDSACSHWMSGPCKERGTCTFFVTKELEMNLLLLFGLFKILSTISLFFATLFYKHNAELSEPECFFHKEETELSNHEILEDVMIK